MKLAPRARHLAAACLLLAACANPDPTPEQEPPAPDAGPDAAASEAPDQSAAADSPPDEDDGAEPLPQEIPEAITSAGARFGGVLGPGESVYVDLTVFQGDRVTMRLAKTDDAAWDPSLNVFRDGQAQPIAYANPSGSVDATIPTRANQLSEGYEFWYTGTYVLELENDGDVAGAFAFTLECRGGSCVTSTTDADLDGIDDADDDCPYNPGNCTTSPYAGLADAALEDAMRADHAGHDVLNYVEARVHMFAWIDKVQGQVECVYTGEKVTTDEIPDAALMNTEHGWPQGRSGGDPATESDLHHLFPTKPDANTERASLYMGEVVAPEWERGGSARGRNAAGDTVFEPRDVHKGNMARALFYYAVTYAQNIRPEEEEVLRRWHAADPPDEVERRRNQAIANVQRSRNPFIDYPELVDAIDDF